MKKIYSKSTMLFAFFLLSFLNVNAQYESGVYTTYEDYLNDKLEVKGRVKSYITVMGGAGQYLVFEKESGEKEKIDLKKVFAVKDQRGFLWKAGFDILAVIVKGDLCFYINVDQCFILTEGLECNKKGKPKMPQTIDFYVSKGINGEIQKGNGTKNIKKLIADNPAATEVLKNNLSSELAFNAVVIYNREHPQKGDYVYPDCADGK